MQEKQETVMVPIKWNVPDGVDSRYANNIIVQPTGGNHKLSFFEQQQYIQTRGDKELPDSIKANCVSSVIVEDMVLRRFIDILKVHLKIEDKPKIVEVEKKEDPKDYPQRLCTEMLHYATWSCDKMKDIKMSEIKESLSVFFDKELIEKAVSISTGK